jgi:hypothetical protein
VNALENRVRRALHADLAGPGADRLLGDVHRGATLRRRRRRAAVVAASVVAVAGVVGIATSLADDEHAAPSPSPASQLPSPSPTESPLPPDAPRGVMAVSVAAPDQVFRLTENVGCTGCSTVWRGDGSGRWDRLHDFAPEDAAELDGDSGPVGDLVMARNGQDGWAWGKRLYSTHDGGHTWARVTNLPGRPSANPHFIAVTGSAAWGVSFDRHGPHVYRTPVGADDWATVPAPHLDRVVGLDTVGERVVLEEKSDGRSNDLLVSSLDDGATWSTLQMPCRGEENGGSVELAMCLASQGAQPTASRPLTFYRTTDLASWSVVGHSSSGINALQPVADDLVLVVLRGRRATLMRPGGTTPVDLPLAPGDQIDQSSWSGDVAYVTVYGEALDYYLITSTDRGRTWRRVP